MKCPEKEELQQKCIAAWNAYAAAASEWGDSPPGIGALFAARLECRTASASCAAALRLRGEHLHASLTLSRHLSGHGC